MQEICTSGSVGGARCERYGSGYTGTKAETPDTDKPDPTTRTPAPTRRGICPAPRRRVFPPGGRSSSKGRSRRSPASSEAT
jgi:hypothetical protein